MPRFSGPRTFMRLPHIRELDGVDVAVVGIPTDGAVVYRSGSRFGPEGIRSASVMLRNYPLLRVDVVEKLSMVDYGDVPTVPGSTVESLERSAAALGEVARAGVTTLCLGGDHSILLAELRALTGSFLGACSRARRRCALLPLVRYRLRRPGIRTWNGNAGGGRTLQPRSSDLHPFARRPRLSLIRLRRGEPAVRSCSCHIVRRRQRLLRDAFAARAWALKDSTTNFVPVNNADIGSPCRSGRPSRQSRRELHLESDIPGGGDTLPAFISEHFPGMCRGRIVVP